MNSLDKFAAGFSAEERRSIYVWCIDHGLISDVCTGLEDVWEGDAAPAVAKLKTLAVPHFNNVLQYKGKK